MMGSHKAKGKANNKTVSKTSKQKKNDDTHELQSAKNCKCYGGS